MKYFDKDGNQWFIGKGDWVGSFDRVEKRHIKDLLIKLTIPIILIIVISAILLNLT
jgi:hypothetical protein